MTYPVDTGNDAISMTILHIECARTKASGEEIRDPRQRYDRARGARANPSARTR